MSYIITLHGGPCDLIMVLRINVSYTNKSFYFLQFLEFYLELKFWIYGNIIRSGPSQVEG
jgi:hypothetical protein